MPIPWSRELDVMLESLQDTLRHLLIDGPDAMGTAPCAAPVAAARAEIAAFLRMARSGRDGEANARDALVRDRGRRDLRDADCRLARTFRCRRAPGMVRRRRDRRGGHARPALCRRADAWAEHDPADAAGAARCVARHPRAGDARRRGVREHADVGGLSGRNRRAGPHAQRSAGRGRAREIRQCRRHADRRAPRGARGADRRSSPDRRRGPKRRRGSRASRSATAKGSRRSRPRADCCCTARDVRDERVVDYQIVAPTEWNFHPDGALPRGLAGLEVDDEPRLLRAARLAVHALDPCVASRIEVGHA